MAFISQESCKRRKEGKGVTKYLFPYSTYAHWLSWWVLLFPDRLWNSLFHGPSSTLSNSESLNLQIIWSMDRRQRDSQPNRSASGKKWNLSIPICVQSVRSISIKVVGTWPWVPVAMYRKDFISHEIGIKYLTQGPDIGGSILFYSGDRKSKRRQRELPIRRFWTSILRRRLWLKFGNGRSNPKECLPVVPTQTLHTWSYVSGPWHVRYNLQCRLG